MRPALCFTVAVMRRWRSIAVSAFPQTRDRLLWAGRVCPLVPVDRIALGAVHMCAVLGGCWDGLRHTPGAAWRLIDSRMWMQVVPVPGAVPDLGIKGATLRVTFSWPYLPSAFLCARA